MNFEQLIKFAVDQNASDLHFQTGASPLLRINGQIRNVESPPLTEDVLKQFILSLRPSIKPEELDEKIYQGLDFSYFVPGLSRFRVNVYSHLDTPAMVMRVIKLKIRTIEELQLPPVIKDIALSHRGMILVTGTTGSGKSTTLAAMLDLINNSYRCKIITIEDPVEYMHVNQKALISQVEVGQDTPAFEQGLRQALRQDPDVILVGELRDNETMRMALRAADTGHQVFATVHSLERVADDRADPGDDPPRGAEDRHLAARQLARGGDLPAAGRHPRGRAPAGHGDPPRRPGDLQVHHRQQARRAERLHRQPRGGDAAVRPAPARALQPEDHHRDRGHETRDQPRGRGRRPPRDSASRSGDDGGATETGPLSPRPSAGRAAG